MNKPLQGYTVVEMSTFVAGPVTARLLADLGATVIKVERPEGDAWRETGISYLPLRFSPCGPLPAECGGAVPPGRIDTGLPGLRDVTIPWFPL